MRKRCQHMKIFFDPYFFICGLNAEKTNQKKLRIRAVSVSMKTLSIYISTQKKLCLILCGTLWLTDETPKSKEAVKIIT